MTTDSIKDPGVIFHHTFSVMCYPPVILTQPSHSYSQSECPTWLLTKSYCGLEAMADCHIEKAGASVVTRRIRGQGAEHHRLLDNVDNVLSVVQGHRESSKVDSHQNEHEVNFLKICLSLRHNI